MKKKTPTLETDAETERFVDTADLSKYNLFGVKALKMKNPPPPGFSVRVDCLESHGLSVTEGAKALGVSRSASISMSGCFRATSQESGFLTSRVSLNQSAFPLSLLSKSRIALSPKSRR